MELDVYALVLIHPKDDPPEPASLDLGGFLKSLSSKVCLDTLEVEHSDFIINFGNILENGFMISVSGFPYAEPTPMGAKRKMEMISYGSDQSVRVNASYFADRAFQVEPGPGKNDILFEPHQEKHKKERRETKSPLKLEERGVTLDYPWAELDSCSDSELKRGSVEWS